MDVKVPWELARMQHLVQLAWAYALSRANRPGFQAPERYSAEFQDQILDFIATNPPRFGVNWSCTMDVAIRVANWLVAYDLFRAHNAAFNHEFENLFLRSVYEHASHIRQNLEWAPDFRGNHYLADIAGLLYASAYLPATPETGSWFSFAARELIRESRRQFHPEGSNFEGSTCYHRLSAEMCVYATALAIHKGIAFPKSHFSRIAAMAQFTADLTKQDHHVPQIGDNDNGRFFKFFPALYRDREGKWHEDHLDHRHLEAACAGLMAPRSQEDPQGEECLVRILAGHSVHLREAEQKDLNSGPNARVWQSWKDRLILADPSRAKCFIYPVTGSDFLSELRTRAYPQFGVYIFGSKRLYLAVRCSPPAPKGRRGHLHNDQLSIELQIDGKDILRDPGGFVYTALPEIRNQYRSVRAHSGPQGQREPGRLDQGLFTLGNQSRAECLYWGEEGFIGRHRGFGSWVTRLIELSPKGINILDIYDDERVARAASEPTPPPFSPGYGLRMDPQKNES